MGTGTPTALMVLRCCGAFTVIGPDPGDHARFAVSISLEQSCLFLPNEYKGGGSDTWL